MVVVKKKIFVTAKPNSKRRMVEKTGENTFTVRVNEPPKDGKANKAIAKALAKHLGVAASRVRLLSGSSSKQKVFEIQ